MLQDATNAQDLYFMSNNALYVINNVDITI